jgi:putative peptidoglycan lipid II flippase
LSKTFHFRIQRFLPGRGAFTLRSFSVTEAATLLILAYLTSRSLGIIRQLLFNILFGTGPQANAYYAAAYLPETLFELIAGGALSHAFVPVFLSYEKTHGQREAWRLTSLVFNMMLVTLTALVLIGEFLAPAFVNNWLVPGYSKAEQALTINLTRVLLLQPLFLGLGTVITAALNSKRQFLLPAVSVAVYNVGLIGGLLVALVVPGVGIYGPTGGMLTAAALQVAVMIPALVKQGARYSFLWNFRHPGLREVLRLLVPNMLAVALTTVSPIIDTAFISYMADPTSLSAQRNALTLISFPLALVAQAIGQATLPQLTSLATAGKYLRMRTTLTRVLFIVLALSALASLAFVVLGQFAIHLFFQHGQFTSHSADVTFIALLGYTIALPVQCAASILILSFYALKNALIPFITTALAFLAHVGTVMICLHFFTGTSQILAIPLALAADTLVTTLVLAATLFLLIFRTKVRQDKGVQRLFRLRSYQNSRVN